jgi:lipopolysaccharide transport system permease protein
MNQLFGEQRYLLLQYTRRQIEQRHRGSVLGVAWTLVQPLLMMGVYTVVFGVIFQGRYAGVENQTTWDYAIGVFLSLTLFHAVAESLSLGSGVVVGQPNLVKKVVFPLEILPLAQVGAGLFQFAISLSLVLVGAGLLGKGLSVQSLWFPVAVLPLVPMIIGISLGISALSVFLRDIQHMAGFASMVLLYASGVFYSSVMVPESIWQVLRFNPLLHVIEQSRRVLLWQLPLEAGPFLYSLACGLAAMVAGAWLFRRLRPHFADVL